MFPLDFGPRGDVSAIKQQLCGGMWRCVDRAWNPPNWLWPHQKVAATRLMGSINLFGGAILADAVGLGKTYVALALATRFRKVSVCAPAALIGQWRAIAAQLGVFINLVSHESLSRLGRIRKADLVIVDEAHWFRNPSTKRYDRLARDISATRVLLVTATPVVNRAADIVHLLRLLLADNGLAVCGLRSIENAALDELANAASSLMVSRSHQCLEKSNSMPGAQDRIFRGPSLRPDVETTVLGLIDRLRFPNFGDVAVPHLLRKHMFRRLASSRSALLETIGRHLNYLRRVMEGGIAQTSRKHIRALVDPSDGSQLDFLSAFSASILREADRQSLLREEKLLLTIAKSIGEPTEEPKAELLKQLLLKHDGKTVVFTSAIATARSLAAHLGWSQLALATGRGARISSGPIPFDTALDLFSPQSRCRRQPQRSTIVNTLIATDVASEGLNLQDADMVVHYDLPWNPLRLQQRTGRIRRLGSEHKKVGVTWFLPPHNLEGRLGMQSLIEAKAQTQVALGLSTSSVVGVSDYFNRGADLREALCTAGLPRFENAGWAMVKGPPLAVCCLRWTFSKGSMFETLAIEPGGVSTEAEAVNRALLDLALKPAADGSIPGWLTNSINEHIRKRLVISRASAEDVSRLSREITKKGREAARRGQIDTLMRLDELLNSLQHGVTEGGKRDATDVLFENRSNFPILHGPTPLRVTRVNTVSLFFGDGSA